MPLRNEDGTTLMLYDIAYRTYVKEERLDGIAEAYGVSKAQISRLLKTAREKKLVAFEFRPPELVQLTHEMRLKFGFLNKVVVVPSTGDYSFFLQTLGKAAADVFEDITAAETGTTPKTVAMSGGIAMYEMVAALPNRERNITIYPAALVGSGPVVGAHIDPNIIVTLLWEKSGRRQNSAYSLSVPVCHASAEVSDPLKLLARHRKQLLASEVVTRLVEDMNSADVMFTGIGHVIGKPVDIPLRSTAVDSLVSLGMEEQWMSEQGMLADINYAFFDGNGNSRRDWVFFLGIGIDEMKRMASDPTRTVVLVGGHHKKEAIEAALRGRLCNVLITDDLAARYLIYGDVAGQSGK